jgi:hypothetical protein
MARLAALLALLVALLVVSGCGKDDTPVAHVGDAKITRAQLDRELKGNAPDYKACLARTKPGSDPALGTPQQQCRYQELIRTTRALATLIHTQWVRQEAKAEGVELTDAERAKARKLFGGDKVDDDLVEVVALDDKLRSRLGHAIVTPSEIDSTVQTLDALHAEKLEVQLVAASSEAGARAARRALATGATFGQVARRYGDKLPTTVQVPKDPRDDALLGYRLGDALRAAVFSAPRSFALVGPVESDGRFYVFSPGLPFAKQKGVTADQLRAEVESDLRTVKQSAAYEQVLARHWLPKTKCEKGYVVNGGLIALGGGAAVYYSTAGCGNFVPFKTPPPN